MSPIVCVTPDRKYFFFMLLLTTFSGKHTDNRILQFLAAVVICADSISIAIDFPNRRGRLTQRNFCSVRILRFTCEISIVLSTYISERNLRQKSVTESAM